MFLRSSPAHVAVSRDMTLWHTIVKGTYVQYRVARRGLSGSHHCFQNARASGHSSSSTPGNGAPWGCSSSQPGAMQWRSSAEAERVANVVGSLQASVTAPVRENRSKGTVQLDAASLACMLAAVYTSHQLRLLSLAIAQKHNAAARGRDVQESAGNAEDTRPKQVAELDTLESPSDIRGRALAGTTAVDLAAARLQRPNNRQQPISTAPPGKHASATPSHPVLRHIALPAPTQGEELRVHGSLGVLLAADEKIGGALRSAEAALSHFQAMIAGDPRLAGELGNEQIKMRAVLQVLQAKQRELLGMVEALQEEESLEVLPESATSCMAEAEAFLLVAEYTIREARSRVLYSQAWPGQQSKTA